MKSGMRRPAQVFQEAPRPYAHHSAVMLSSTNSSPRLKKAWVRQLSPSQPKAWFERREQLEKVTGEQGRGHQQQG